MAHPRVHPPSARFPNATDTGRVKRGRSLRHTANASLPVYSSPFASHPHAISLAFSAGRLLAVGGDSTSTECSNQVTAYDFSGNSTPFATLPDQPLCLGSELEDSLIPS